MTAPAVGAPGSWWVTSESRTTQTRAGGGFETGYTVGFTTGLGASGSVFVNDQAISNAATAKAIIGAAAANLDEVHTLTNAS